MHSHRTMFIALLWIASVAGTTTTIAAVSHSDDPTAPPAMKRHNDYIRVAPNCGVACTRKPIKPSTRSPLNSPSMNTGGGSKQIGTSTSGRSKK
jgi:hypothetical protein